MARFLVLGAFTACLCAPSEASFRVQQLLQIPAALQQRVVDLKTDSHGNLSVSAFVALPDSYVPADYGVIKKLDTAGNEIFSRVLPGAGIPLPVAIHTHDDIYVAGQTAAPLQFPFTNRLAATWNSAFIMKLRGSDGAIVYSTSLNYTASPASLAIDSNGQAILAGAGTPAITPGAYASPLGNYFGTPQVSLMRISQAGDQVLFLARYGGQNKVCFGMDCLTTQRMTSAAQVLVDRAGNIWVAGTTNTTDLPVTSNALKATCGCGLLIGDGFLAEFSSDGSRLLSATYIGTSAVGTLGPDGDDWITDIALDGASHLWIAGYTNGRDFPVTSNAVQQQRADLLASGITDGFLAEYDPATNRLLYATYFGGSRADTLSNIQIGAGGEVLFSGYSGSPALPVPAAGFVRGTDFVASLDPAQFTITGLTRFVTGTTGVGLAVTPSGLVASGANNVLTLLSSGDASGPSLFAVANAEGAAITGQVAPGEIISLYGVHIGPQTPVAADLSSGQAPTLLGGVQVMVEGTPAPVLYAQDDQVNAIVPFGASGTIRVAIDNDGASSNSALLGVVAALPDAFKTSPRLWAAVLNQDGSVNSNTNRAKPGSLDSVFGTGFGALLPAPADGQMLSGSLPLLAEGVQVNLLLPSGVQPLEITYAGPASTLVAGVIQVNFRLPEESLVIPEPQFSFTVGGWASGAFVVLTQ